MVTCSSGEEQRAAGVEEKGTSGGLLAKRSDREEQAELVDREVRGLETGCWPSWPPENGCHLHFSGAMLELVSVTLEPGFVL